MSDTKPQVAVAVEPAFVDKTVAAQMLGNISVPKLDELIPGRPHQPAGHRPARRVCARGNPPFRRRVPCTFKRRADLAGHQLADERPRHGHGRSEFRGCHAPTGASADQEVQEVDVV